MEAAKLYADLMSCRPDFDSVVTKLKLLNSDMTNQASS
jgi:hypothetical protein